MSNNYKFLLLVAFSILFYSCKTTQKTTVSSSTVLSDQTKTGTVRISEPNVTSANFNNISLRINVEGRSFSSRASMKIIRDSIIQLSLQPMIGIEMARIDISPKGFLILNKIQGRYFEADASFLASSFGVKVDYSNLQALLLNRIFVAGENLSSSSEVLLRLTATSYPDGYMLKGRKNAAGFTTEFTLDKDSRVSGATILYANQMLQCVYSRFTDNRGIVFPYKYKLSAIQGPNVNSCEMEVQSVEFNGEVKINATEKEKYKRVDKIDQLVQF